MLVLDRVGWPAAMSPAMSKVQCLSLKLVVGKIQFLYRD